jgi:molybdopterin/thiamine biosynthesis adenylyltransferase
MIDHTRHIGIFYAKDYSVVLIGAGGIGAISAVTLGKMGVGRLHIYDVDTVEDVNVATQFYDVSDIGISKINAITAKVENTSDANVIGHNVRVLQDFYLPSADIYISGVDSIKSRKDIWDAVCRSWLSNGHNWYVDARMSSEYLQVYVVNSAKPEFYTQSLEGQSDDDIPDEPCTSRATIYTGCIAAGVIGSIVRKIITHKQDTGILTYDIIENRMLWMEA